MLQSSKHVSDAMRTLLTRRTTKAHTQSVWVLVDPALHSPLIGSGVRPPHAILPIPNLAEELSPRLIKLDMEQEERAVQRTIEIAAQEVSGDFDDEVHGRPRSICAWIEPISDELSVSARLLADAAKLRLPEGAERSLALRFWDPRITADLITLQSPATWSNHLERCGIAQWWYLDESMSLIPTVFEPIADPSEPVSLPWQPSRDQWQKLHQLGWRNRILHLSQGWACLETPTRASIDTYITQAVNAGLTHETDIVCFVHACLTISSQFDQHPAVQQSLKACKDTSEPGLLQAQYDVWRPALEASVARSVSNAQ